jgi:hypothetical protein
LRKPVANIFDNIVVESIGIVRFYAIRVRSNDDKIAITGFSD